MLEVLSRLVLRLPPENAKVVFDMALECYRNHEVSEEPLLGESVGNLLQRSWESLPAEIRTSRAIDLLAAPIVGMDNFRGTTGLRYPDAAESLRGDDLPVVRSAQSDRRWEETVKFLIRGLGGVEEARRRAATRILLLAEKDLLTEAESLEVAQALWTERYTSPGNLPVSTTLADWAFAHTAGTHPWTCRTTVPAQMAFWRRDEIPR